MLGVDFFQFYGSEPINSTIFVTITLIRYWRQLGFPGVKPAFTLIVPDSAYFFARCGPESSAFRRISYAAGSYCNQLQ
jgi:hypothetical protein